MKRGYYSVIQYMPDAARAECINVGVVLHCPSVNKFPSVRIDPVCRRARRLLGGNPQPAAVSMGDRIGHEKWKDVDDFQHFVDTRANAIRLTDPRPIKITKSAAAEVDKLYEELVVEPGWVVAE